MSDPTDELVPHRLQVFYACIRCAPWTELKTFSGLVLLYLTALWLVLAAAFKVAVAESILDSWLLFLSGLLAIASFGQGWKQNMAAKFGPSSPPPAKP